MNDFAETAARGPRRRGADRRGHRTGGDARPGRGHRGGRRLRCESGAEAAAGLAGLRHRAVRFGWSTRPARRAGTRTPAYPLVRCRSPDDSPALRGQARQASRAAVNNDAGISTNCSPGGTSMPAFSALSAYP